MYIKEQITKVVCDYCGAFELPDLESVGLVKGWCCYKPEYLGTALGPRQRVDFCSEKHRDLWLERHINLLRQQMWGRKIAYHFSTEKYIYDVTVADQPMSKSEQLLHDVFQQIQKSVPEGMRLVDYDLDVDPLAANEGGKVDFSQVPQEIKFTARYAPVGENEK